MAIGNQEKVWEQILIKLSEELDHPAFQAWIKPAKFHSLDDTSITVSTNNVLSKEWIHKNYSTLITKIAKEENLDKKKKLEIIDNFIASNPKIPPVNKDTPVSNLLPIEEDKSYLMTETLAKVYLEQKKYTKAIQAYEILILKYPEKSSFFADRILDIKNLQQNNN